MVCLGTMLSTVRRFAKGAVVCLIAALAAPSARAADILMDAQRAVLGQSTEGREDIIVGLVEKGLWPDLEKSIAADDEIGLRQLHDEGKLVVITDTQELLIIDIDISAATKFREDMLQVVDGRIGVYRHCIQLNIAAAGRASIPCYKPNIDDEYVRAYRLLQPKLTPEEFMDENVFVRVRILTGDAKGSALWTRLKYLKLPTHARIQDSK